MSETTLDAMGMDQEVTMLRLMTAHAAFAQRALDAFSALRGARASGVPNKMLDARRAWEGLCDTFWRG
ncbi:hypothetical protein [Roseomonas xinghualingensis]|uniref:hypothetical protein n=1 Tax=Roseomonas xinghualingensis TaxID=2986475 RepID=UPI0021F0E2D1|nr:hypothetical protein [Roseomonas sp. SXEYE001]MCV4210065.1 hypothetical protein [Roseomonas sp. SXEYE001]